MNHIVSWFEIPASDFDRACKFYTEVLGHNLELMEVHGTKMGMWPMDGSNISGSIVHGDDYKPASNGTCVYLNGGDDLSVPLGKVESAGGTIIVPKTEIGPEMGFFALFIDTEGNKIGFHSPQ